MIKRLIRAIFMFPIIYLGYVLFYVALIGLGAEPQGHIWDNLFPIALGWLAYSLFAPSTDN